MDLMDIKACVAKEREVLAQYNIKSIGVFGSFVRGEQRDKSDIDLLVEFENDDMDLFTFIELKNYLSKRLGRKVDLVMKDTLKPHIGKRILDEVVYLKNYSAQLLPNSAETGPTGLKHKRPNPRKS